MNQLQVDTLRHIKADQNLCVDLVIRILAGIALESALDQMAREFTEMKSQPEIKTNHYK